MIFNKTEELKLIFALNDVNSPENTEYNHQKMTIKRKFGSISCLDAIYLLIERINFLGIDNNFIENDGIVSADMLIKKIRIKKNWGQVETAELSFQYGVVSSCEHCFVTIREKIPHVAGSWEEWAASFIALHGFIQGWVLDVEYDYWQNAKDPLLYEFSGRDFSHLPMKSNGLPPPVQRLEIDISKNPGRWMLRAGYVEAIGATMWLSEMFWSRVGMDHKLLVNSADWLHTSEPVKGVIKIKAAEHCFSSEETADSQNQLRRYLYG